MSDFKISKEEMDHMIECVQQINENLAIWANGASKVLQQAAERIESGIKNIHPPSNRVTKG